MNPNVKFLPVRGIRMEYGTIVTCFCVHGDPGRKRLFSCDAILLIRSSALHISLEWLLYCMYNVSYCVVAVCIFTREDLDCTYL